jgi:hypothetical protein
VEGGDANINTLTVGLGNNAISTNTAIGYQTLIINSSGSNNTAIGNLALDLNTTGNNNTAIGHSALTNVSTGSGNVAIGSSAGGSLAGGTGNTFIGYNTSTGGANRNMSTAIGAGATVDTDNTIVLGTATETVSISGLLQLSSEVITGTTFVLTSATLKSIYFINTTSNITITLPNILKSGVLIIFRRINTASNVTLSSASGVTLYEDSSTTGGISSFVAMTSTGSDNEQKMISYTVSNTTRWYGLR